MGDVQFIVRIPRSALIAPRAFNRKKLGDRLRDYAVAALAAQHPDVYDAAISVSSNLSELPPLPPSPPPLPPRRNNAKRRRVTETIVSSGDTVPPSTPSPPQPPTIERVSSAVLTESSPNRGTTNGTPTSVDDSPKLLPMSQSANSVAVKSSRKSTGSPRSRLGDKDGMSNLAFRIDTLMDWRLDHMDETPKSWSRPIYPFLWRNLAGGIKKLSRNQYDAHGFGSQVADVKVRCRVCGAGYSSRYKVDSHMQKVHCDGIGLFKCNEEDCPHAFATRASLNVHISRTHGTTRETFLRSPILTGKRRRPTL